MGGGGKEADCRASSVYGTLNGAKASSGEIREQYWRFVVSSTGGLWCTNTMNAFIQLCYNICIYNKDDLIQLWRTL